MEKQQHNSHLSPSLSRRRELMESGWSLRKLSTPIPETEREDGSERMSQPHHDPHLHLPSLRDRTARNPPRKASDVHLATP
ncbi:hypothetical protein EUGRSUZ_L01199 [Eucalyptus grandis]|uniref:Uncharacterized protein n=1 Tax=Eucalyptus grandis TaxID=71139 RepID=A0A058ZUP1_EUCGR|nr:hypothetical protein EUGRSUZ_L01199 [Eucalyptus grandis]